MNQSEVWKDIIGYEGLYQVSSLGRVRSKDRIVNAKVNQKYLKKGRILKQAKDSRGYLFVGLSVNAKQKLFRVHRLVAVAFVTNDDTLNKIEVNHKNRDITDNRKENLEWCTHRVNCNHRYTKNIGNTRFLSKYVGLAYDKRSDRWVARIRVKGKKKYVGSHKDEHECFKILQKFRIANNLSTQYTIRE